MNTDFSNLAFSGSLANQTKQLIEKPKEPVTSSADQKTKEVLTKTKAFSKNPNMYASGDSDDELSDSYNTFSIFQRHETVKAESMTIQCKNENGEIKNIKGSGLIEIVHDKIQYEYDLVIDYACEYEKDIDGAAIPAPEEKEGIITIRASRDWLMTIGGWKGMMPSEEIKDYFFYSSIKKKKFNGAIIYDNNVTFYISNHRIHITKGFSIKDFNVTDTWEKKNNKFVKVPSGKTDLSYGQIVKAIKYIKKTFGLSDSDIAKLQLYAFSRVSSLPKDIWQKTPLENQKEILQFLDYMNCLMFGIEASGLNAAVIISFMTLDLIVDGKLSYETAFKANKDGGIYPYATFGDNKGTYNAREAILLHNKEKRDPLSMKEYRENPELSPVAVKEAILIKIWLQSNQIISEGELYGNQIERINQSIDDLFYYYFAPWVKRKRFLKKFAE